MPKVYCHKDVITNIFSKLQKGYSRLAAASDKDYQLLAYGRWFSPGTPDSSTTKTGRHDIGEILLKVTLSTINKSINQSINIFKSSHYISLVVLNTIKYFTA